MYESFKDYVAVETLKEENKYDAGDLGMQVSLEICFETALSWILILLLLSSIFPSPGSKEGGDLCQFSPSATSPLDAVPV